MWNQTGGWQDKHTWWHRSVCYLHLPTTSLALLLFNIYRHIASLSLSLTHTHSQSDTCPNINICTHVHTCMHTHTHTHTHSQSDTCPNINICTHVHKHTYTHTHTHTHTHKDQPLKANNFAPCAATFLTDSSEYVEELQHNGQNNYADN